MSDCTVFSCQSFLVRLGLPGTAELLADLPCLPFETAQVPFTCFIFSYSLVGQAEKAGLIFI